MVRRLLALSLFGAACLSPMVAVAGQPPGVPLGLIGSANGVAGLDASAKVAAAQVVNRPTISPSVTSAGTSATTVFPAGPYVSVRIRMTGSGQSFACTGDGTAPAIGTSTTATAPGQDIFWPVQAGGAMPSGPFQCVASGTVNIDAEAH